MAQNIRKAPQAHFIGASLSFRGTCPRNFGISIAFAVSIRQSFAGGFCASRTALIGTRLQRRYFGVFRLAVLAGRQPACVRRAVNHTNYHPFQVRRSFAGRDLCLGKAKPQGILYGLLKILTQPRRKSLRQNRVQFGAVRPGKKFFLFLARH